VSAYIKTDEMIVAEVEEIKIEVLNIKVMRG
jgi:hypothetical protein